MECHNSHKVSQSCSRNWRCTGTETRQSFFHMLTMAKIWKSFFTPIWYGLAVCASMCFLCPSFHMLGWTIGGDACKWIRRWEKKKTEDSGAFFEVEHWQENSIASHYYTQVNKFIIYMTTQKRNAPINKWSRSKAPRTQWIFFFNFIYCGNSISWQKACFSYWTT